MKIAFIGLGIMGKPMAKNLLKAGYELVVYNRSRAAMEDVAQAGAKMAPSAADAVKEADVVMTMLPNSPEVKEVMRGDGGAAYAMKA